MDLHHHHAKKHILMVFSIACNKLIVNAGSGGRIPKPQRPLVRKDIVGSGKLTIAATITKAALVLFGFELPFVVVY